MTFEPVYFDSDQATLRRSEIDKLEGVVATLKAHPDLTLRLIGNTDSLASDSYNNRLSMNRIKAVATYLIDHGIAPERLRYKALGEQSPAADNSSEAGRALNQRVELIP
ncbi:MAG TPA: OmpA family protein [Gammaproteobacteria bacterium]|nr:OmpA family protein [Gammaproteobacteria bacterium]